MSSWAKARVRNVFSLAEFVYFRSYRRTWRRSNFTTASKEIWKSREASILAPGGNDVKALSSRQFLYFCPHRPRPRRWRFGVGGSSLPCSGYPLLSLYLIISHGSHGTKKKARHGHHLRGGGRYFLSAPLQCSPPENGQGQMAFEYRWKEGA